MIERPVELLMIWAPQPSFEYQAWPAWRRLEPHCQCRHKTPAILPVLPCRRQSGWGTR